MNKKTKSFLGLMTGTFLIIIVVISCGCTENNGSVLGSNVSMFLGTWVGSMEFSSIPFGTNATPPEITQLEFTQDTMYMTISMGNSTQTMAQGYSIEGNRLMFSFQFSGEMPNGSFPMNGSRRPPFEGERPWNSSQPFSGESPWNGSRPFNGEQSPPGGRSSMARGYSYSFNNNQDVLYLDGNPFEKIG